MKCTALPFLEVVSFPWCSAPFCRKAPQYGKFWNRGASTMQLYIFHTEIW